MSKLHLNLGSIKSKVHSFQRFVGYQSRGIFNFYFSILINFFRITEIRLINHITKEFIILFSGKLHRGYLSPRFRKIISIVQPTDPLRSKMSPAIDIAIPCHNKDLDNVSVAIDGAVYSVKNPIGRIKLITPENSVKSLQAKFPSYEVSSDENILEKETVNLITTLLPANRRGWIFQQIIKLKVALNSSEIATLIVDADTILIKPKTWINSDGTQILCVANELHPPYKNHQRRVFGGINYPLSFVTHHQLMKQESLIQIFGTNGNGIARWLELADFSEKSPISEFDSYGEWMISNRPKEIRFSKWNNLATKLDKSQMDFQNIIRCYSKYDSISNHSYL